MNIWQDIPSENINKQEDASHSKLNEELRNCFARMRELKDDMTAEAATRTDLEGEQFNDSRVSGIDK
jgi:hypothetical protein